MSRLQLLMNKLLNNKNHLFILIPFLGGIFFSFKNNSEFGVEFVKIQNKMTSLDKQFNDWINKFK